MRCYKNTLEIIRDQPSQNSAEIEVKPGEGGIVAAASFFKVLLDLSQQERDQCGLSDF